MPAIQRLEKSPNLFSSPDIPTLEFWQRHVAIVDVIEDRGNLHQAPSERLNHLPKMTRGMSSSQEGRCPNLDPVSARGVDITVGTPALGLAARRLALDRLRCTRPQEGRARRLQNLPLRSRSAKASRSGGRRAAASSIWRWMASFLSRASRRSAARPARSPARRRFRRNSRIAAAVRIRPSALRAGPWVRSQLITAGPASSRRAGRGW